MTVFQPVTIDQGWLDHLMPLHLLMTESGRIVTAGRTLIKVFGGTPLAGRAVSDLLAPRRKTNTDLITQLRATHTGKVHVRLRDAHQTQMIAATATLPDARLFASLSFGISIFDAVARYRLAGSDFSPTDLTLEMLYLAEANSAVMAESRRLNHRLHGAKTRAEQAALTDTLTGLQNRRGLELVLARLRARGIPFTLAHLDLDFFKTVNDTHGHAAGDHVLTEVARILREETRTQDTVARVGGDEFVLVFDDLVTQEPLAAISTRIIARLEHPIPYRDVRCKISASIGLVPSTQYAKQSLDKMFIDADRALYASKAAGRARFTFHDELQKPV